ncbi:MAG: glutamate 5-kinase [Clostridiales bacterium]|jgi:glutamate 5-kinase|nr:glutamate 5-kinase [Clostridiales bacterium]
MRFQEKRRIVVKVGSSTLAGERGRMNLSRFHGLSWVLTDLRNSGRDVVLVSSGAIAVGAARMNIPKPEGVAGKQAASAVGQAILMQMYENFFTQYNQIVAQVLLTKDVAEDAEKRENARSTFFALFERGVIPIVNENDAVSTEELGFSDNDALSAYVADITGADLLIILSDIDGLYSADPKKDPSARFMPSVQEITPEIEALAASSKSPAGTGGMVTKLSAAKMAVSRGIDVVVASGAEPIKILSIARGENIGTFFARKHLT